jgi:hypothetical protein
VVTNEWPLALEEQIAEQGRKEFKKYSKDVHKNRPEFFLLGAELRVRCVWVCHFSSDFAVFSLPSVGSRG